MGRRFLIVTANDNETSALLEDHEFFPHESGVRSEIPDDALFYNKGRLGQQDVVQFQLPDQGSVRSDSSLPSVLAAIEAWKPHAVILLGVAFGKDNEEKPEPRQHIGDVLVSTRIVDYESGRFQGGALQSDGSQPDSGRHLRGIFQAYAKTWQHLIGERVAEAHFGPILSGDKVVDDADFKRGLFDAYPRAIGGEMEGRGAYAACRHKGIDEWIIVKGICDWGERKQTPNKDQDQLTAARAAVSLLKHVFSDGNAFAKLPSPSQPVPPAPGSAPIVTAPVPIGYCVSIGTTSCRLFEVLDSQTLKEVAICTYDVSDTDTAHRDDYLAGIISHVKNELLPKMRGNPAHLLQKVFVDSSFAGIFDQYGDAAILRDFCRTFYAETNLYFNILSRRQTLEHLKRLFDGLPDDTAILNIGSQSTDVLVYSGGAFSMYTLDISLADVRRFVGQHSFPPVWTDAHLAQIREFVRARIGDQLKGISISNAIIIKDELRFMRDTGYPLMLDGSQYYMSQRAYKNANRRLLFFKDYEGLMASQHEDESTVHRLSGFRYGHALIEIILDMMNNERVIPRNEVTIHGSGANAYIFNVAISGSTHSGRDVHIVEASRIIGSMGANVLSPPILNGKLAQEITADSEYEHLKAIDECDVLFVCNRADDGYIGETTKCEIYYAYAMRKTIAFWREPPDDKRLSFIPHEHWGAIKSFTA